MCKVGLRTGYLTLCHCAVDFACALLCFARLRQNADWGLLLLLYNFCAFALQLPFGILADQWGGFRRFSALGCLLAAAAYLIPAPLPAALAAGIGNGLFHVGGGCEVMQAAPKRAGELGVFVSAGALGLYLGTLLGKSGALPLWIAAVVSVLLGCGCLFSGKMPEQTEEAAEQPENWLPIVGLFLVVVLRSCGGFLQTFPWKTGPAAFFAVLATVLGKAAGGFLADRFGLRRASVLSLLPAAVLFCFANFWPAGLAAIFLFNLTMPITLFGLSRRYPEHRGACFGLLTLALFLGFLPTYFGAAVPANCGLLLAGVCLISLALLLPSVGVRHGK